MLNDNELKTAPTGEFSCKNFPEVTPSIPIREWEGRGGVEAGLGWMGTVWVVPSLRMQH